MIDQRAKLLIIDDSPDNLFVLEQIVREHLPGFDLIQATNPEDGLKLAAETSPDGALVDMQMPRIDGIELCRRLKADGATQHIPVILMTAHSSSPALRARGLEAGADDFISRPINNLELVARIKVMLRIQRAEEALQWELMVNRTLADLSKTLLSSSLDLGATAELVLQHARDLTGSAEGCVTENATENGETTLRARTPNFVREIAAGDDAVQSTAAGTTGGVLSIPILLREKVAGRIILSNPARDFGARDMATVEKLAGIYALALQRHLDRVQMERLRAQLQQAQKMEAIGNLAGGIAHDFNNILAAVVGYTEFSRESIPPGTMIHENLGEVLQAAYRARDLIKQIHTFSRAQEPPHTAIFLQTVVQEALGLLKINIPPEVALLTKIDTETGVVLADATQMHQVVMNLVTNALQAMEETGGKLKVELAPVNLNARAAADHPALREGDYIRLTVQDTGLGMDEATRQRIFEPYFSTKPEGRGNGLGLAVVHGIVTAHGGAITVDSEPGNGATFRIFLPLFAAGEIPGADG